MAPQWFAKLFTPRNPSSALAKLLSFNSNTGDEAATPSPANYELQHVINIQRNADQVDDPAAALAPTSASFSDSTATETGTSSSASNSASLSNRTVTETGTSTATASRSSISSVSAPTLPELAIPIGFCLALICSSSVPPSIQENPKEDPVYCVFFLFAFLGAIIPIATIILSVTFPDRGVTAKRRALVISFICFAVAFLFWALDKFRIKVGTSMLRITALLAVAAVLLVIVAPCVVRKRVRDDAAAHEQPHAS